MPSCHLPMMKREHLNCLLVLLPLRKAPNTTKVKVFLGDSIQKITFFVKESSRKMINCRRSWHCMDPNTSWISNCWNSMDSLVISWPWISGRLELPASTRPCGRGRRPRWRAKWGPWGRRSRWRERSSFSVYFVFIGAATASTKTKWFR